MLKKRLVSTASALLTAVLIVSMAGCQKGSETVGGGSTSGGAVSATDAKTGTSGNPVSDEKITLKMLTTEWPGIQVGNDMAVYQELEKRTNVHLEFTLLPVEAALALDKFNLIMASGDLPDIVGYSRQDAIVKYGMQGAFIPLQDLINQYAPNIKKTLDNPLQGEKLPYKMDNWAEVTSEDGNIYSIPLFSCSNAIGAVYAIRTDWLDKLDLKMPETADELYEVLKAFKERDPNGNQKADEIPFASGAGGKTATILPVVNAFDAHMDLYIDKKDDTVKYGPVEESYKQGLAFLNKLYKEGLIEEDYLTATRDQWNARATSSQIGFMFVWPASGIGGANSGLQKVDPDFKFVPIAPLKSTSGAQYKDTYTAGRYLQGRNAISKSNKYPVETIKYLDYCFTEEGGLLASYGVEGLDYTLVNNEPAYTDRILKNTDGKDPETAAISDGINWTSLPYQIGWDPQIQQKKDSAPWTVNAWELYWEEGMVEAPFPTLQYTSSELARKNQIVTEINTYKDAMVDRLIMGLEPLEKFDDFIASINKAGLPELIKISNDAYARYKKFGSR